MVETTGYTTQASISAQAEIGLESACNTSATTSMLSAAILEQCETLLQGITYQEID